jgi:hypothetical protein
MDYRTILSSAYSWMSVDKAKLFLLFFWVSLPFLIILPSFFEKDLIYTTATKPIAMILYGILYFTLFLGLIVLIQYCLKKKNEKVSKMDLKKIVAVVKLVFLEGFYVFVWNINSKLRFSQILLLISTGLFFIISSIFPNSLWIFVLFISSSIYALLVVYNFGRIFFSSTVFCSEDNYSTKQAIMRSWALTHGKLVKSFSPILWVLVLMFLMFAFITLALGSFAAIFLKIFLIEPLAISIGFKTAAAFALAPCLIAYHYAIADVYSQLKNTHNSSISIKRILAHRVLNKKKVVLKKKSQAKKRK